MKLNILLTAIYIFIAYSVGGQNPPKDTLVTYYNKYPEKAIQEAEVLFQKAIKTNNSPLLIKSLILKTTFSTKIDEDNFPKQLQEIEARIQSEKDVAAKSILHSYAGQLYADYFRQNNYTIRQRTSLVGEVPESITEWSGNLFREKIFSHYLASIEIQEILQQTPVKNYSSVMIVGNASDSLRPTLYDFLCFRVIEALPSVPDISGNKPEFPLQESPVLFSGLDEFIQIPVQEIPLDAVSNVLKTYQNLLSFRKKADNPEALLMADLLRLQYADLISRLSNKYSFYFSTLQAMEKQYSSSPMVVEILNREAQVLLLDSPDSFNNPTPKTIENEQKARAICEEGIRKYPNYNRINILRLQLERVKSPIMTIEFPKSVYPGKDIRLNIKAKNIDNMTLSISQINGSTASYLQNSSKKGGIIPGKFVYKRTLTPLAGIMPVDTVLVLPQLESGLYQLTFQNPKLKKTITEYIICTQLFPIQQHTPKGYRFLVRDYMSGTPIKGAKIRIYKQAGYRNFGVLDSVYTNSEGIATAPTTGYNYEVVNNNNPNGFINTLAQGFSRYNKPSADDSKNLMIITDRKIYRPGQTIYFKGISWQAFPDTLFIDKGKTYKVIFRDSREKEISTQTFTTNGFGSFAGHFVIPDQVLNGEFSIAAGDTRSYITVAEYKRPEFDIVFKSSDKNYYSGDPVKIEGNVNSFSGVALANTRVEYKISRHSYFRWNTEDFITQGVTLSGSDGEFTIAFKAEIPDVNTIVPSGWYYQVEARVTDTKGETQESATDIRVYPKHSAPVITMPEIVNKTVPTFFRFSLPDGTPEISHRLQYSISKLVTPKNLSVQPEITDTLVEKTILKNELSIRQTDSIRPDLSTYESGAYLLTATNGEFTAKSVFYLYAPTDKRPPIPVYNWLVNEKTQCFPGESACILFGTSVNDAHVTCEIYTLKGLAKQFQKNISNETVSFDIPFPESYGTQAWFVINYVKDGHYIQNTVPLQKLKRQDRNLTLVTKVFRDKLTPGQQEQWEIHVNNPAGNQPTEVLAMMYDASLDKLRPYDINFDPSYKRFAFPYQWFTGHNLFDKDNRTIDSWAFNLPNIKIVPFRYDLLNTYDFMTNLGSALESLPLAPNRYNSSIRIRGTATDMTMKAEGADESAVSSNVSFRQNFAETAFFYPQLQTDSAGNVQIKFTVPETTTSWKFTTLAYTRDLAVGQMVKYITTSRQLMVRPNLPRFFRSGDKAELKVTVSNLSDSRQAGKAVLEIFVPQSNKTLLNQSATFDMPAGESQTVQFTFDVPQGIDLAGCKVSAVSQTFSDGEQRLLPVLPDRIMVTSTQPIYATTQGSHSFSLQPGPSSRQDYRLTLEVAANPIWYAVMALPPLLEPQNENVTDIAGAFYVNTLASHIARSNPKIAEAIRIWTTDREDSGTLISKLEQNAELKSILLEASPWVMQAQNETEQMHSLQQLFDQNRLEYLQSQALEKLRSLQTENGGWSWFKGMYPSRFMTCNVLSIMVQASITGDMQYGESEKMMQIKALRYLDNELKKDYGNKSGQVGYNQLLYLYTRSLYRDIPLGDALEAHKYYIALAQKQWAGFSLYEKAITASAMFRYGLTKDAHAILESLRQYAVNNPEQGMYWPNNRNTFSRNSAILVHTAIMEAFHEIEGNIPETDRMKQWLLNQKQTQNWGNVPATVNAIYALLLSGSDQLSASENLKVTLGKTTISMPESSNPLGYIKETIPAASIKKDMLTAKITKMTNSPTWGGLYLQYFAPIDQIEKESGEIKVDKQLFTEQRDANDNLSLVPISQQAAKIGDKVIIRLTLSLNRDMEFMHLKDLRAACFEPQKQMSGNQWKFGTVYYEDVKDASTNLFFNALSRGTYVIEYPVWINQAGDFQDGIATFQSIYAPEFSARSAAGKIKVGN